MKYEVNETLLKELKLKGLDVVAVDPKEDILKNKGYNIKTLNLNNLGTKTFSPLEIPNLDEINKYQEQLSKQSELTGIPKHILIQFNNEMREQNKKISYQSFFEWASGKEK